MIAVSDLRERWAARVEVGAADECWPWAGYLSAEGYGRLGFQGRDLLAHRIAYELYIGSIPTGLTIDHLCRNRKCVNPAHLEAVTRGENVLRGDSRVARQARQTECARGHAFDESNTFVGRDGRRRCRTCRREYTRVYYPEYRRRRRAR